MVLGGRREAWGEEGGGRKKEGAGGKCELISLRDSRRGNSRLEEFGLESWN